MLGDEKRPDGVAAARNLSEKASVIFRPSQFQLLGIRRLDTYTLLITLRLRDRMSLGSVLCQALSSHGSVDMMNK